MSSFYPQYDLAGRIQHTKLDTGFSDMPSARMTRVETPATSDFKQVMSGLVENLNTELNAPDNMLKDVMSGSKKVIQAYDKVMQIQV